MKYTLNQLQIFLKVVQTESITKASEELHLTQPAVSIQLKNFQDQFDIPLTEIVGRKIYITDFGRQISEAVEQIINQVDAINDHNLAFKGKLAGKLKLSVVSTGKYLMPYFLADFVKQHPGIELNMDVTNKDQVVQSIENNQVDFALVSILPPSLSIDTLELLSNKLYLVGGAHAALNSTLKAKDLFGNLPLIFRESGSGTRQAMEQFFETKNIRVVKKMELTGNEAVKQAVMAGLGFSIMPLIGIKNELQSKELQIIPLKGLPIVTTWRLIWLKQKKLSPIAQSFLAYLKTNQSKIVQEKFSWTNQLGFK